MNLLWLSWSGAGIDEGPVGSPSKVGTLVGGNTFAGWSMVVCVAWCAACQVGYRCGIRVIGPLKVLSLMISWVVGICGDRFDLCGIVSLLITKWMKLQSCCNPA